MAIRNLQISRDSADSLREWSDEFREALVLGDFKSWAADFGHLRSTDALMTTFPIPIDAAGYKLLSGDITFRKLYERSLTMIMKEWFDAIKAKAAFVESDQFSDWGGAPGRMAVEWNRFPQVQVALMLALSTYAGPLLDLYRDPDSQTASTRRMFATDHPFNVLDSSVGSFDNTITCVRSDIADGTLLKNLNKRFRLIKGPNGQDLGLKMAGGNFLVPSEFDNDFMEFTKQDTLIRAVLNVGKTENVAAVTQNNIWGKTVGYEVGVELSRPASGGNLGDYLYAFGAPKPGMYPWVVQQASAPEEILHDKSSEMYKNSLEIGVAYIGRMNVAGCLPHNIIRVHVTDSNP
jgi:hypothetical protein